MGEKNSKLMPEDLSELTEHTAFTEKEIEDWYSGFKRDYPQGYLTVSTFKKIYKKIFPRGKASMFAENVFRVFDHNNDNRIDFREFIIAMSISMRGTLEEKARWMFQLYDTNSDGFISKDEMLLIINAIYQMSNKKCDTSTAGRRVDQIYKDMDTDGDNQLSFEEFLVLARSDPAVLAMLETE